MAVNRYSVEAMQRGLQVITAGSAQLGNAIRTMAGVEGELLNYTGDSSREFKEGMDQWCVAAGRIQADLDAIADNMQATIATTTAADEDATRVAIAGAQSFGLAI